MSEPFHQLAAILFVDIVGYSAMMQEDEHAAIQKINHFRDVLEVIAGELDGKIIQYYGDGCLLLFNSATDSAEFAKLLQADLFEDPKVPARVGIHMGDVLIHHGNVFGDVVNIAARIQALAPTGGIYVSEMVYRNIVNKQGLDCMFVKEEKLKNIKEPFRIYELLTPNSQPVQVFVPEIPVKSKTSIAVLPFFNMSNDQDQEYFSDGLTEDIITQLSKIKALKVVSRTSVMQYKKNPKHVKEIGRELDVAVILEGSVQRSQEQVRITAQLIDAATDEHLWADSYDRSVKDIFSIQREVALAIADVLNAKLSQQEEKQLDQTPTSNLEAYDLYLRGKFLVEKRTKPEVLEARELFEQAVSKDNNFANAYSGLAVTYLLASYRGYEDPVKMLWMAKKYIDLALALNPMSGESHASLGYWYHQKFDWHAAEITYKRSLDLSPNQSNVYLWLGILLEGKGENEEALKIYEKGCSINPAWDYLTVNQVRCLVNAGKKEDAIALQKKLIEKNATEPDMQKVYYGDLARLYWSAGNPEEAIAAAEKAGNKGLLLFFKDGDNSALQKRVDEKYDRLKKNSDYISQLWMGIDYARAGAREKALDCFNNAIALKDVAITYLLINHYDFLNIKYLNMALITRKLRMLVNF
ncbi:adenylate/guanylate cyclase domain-containing protein [Flavisolibacter nicotianae]|uniref:adenylate/guanylate cyclase domain-containing protein n=1 Tax=Flavisolibacter nicotianae TaxID=2364882 RepID=UPI000EAB6139|nr:adenylate/guanylate cyclase domain-containing protein [Flavisolibacter nicotianae]